MSFQLDTDRLVRIESGIDTTHPGRSEVPVTVLGFGEISSVIAFDGGPDLEPYVFKRLPIFHTLDEGTRHEDLCREYVRLIRSGAGIDAQDTGFFSVPARPGLVVFYAIQRRLAPASIGHHILHWASVDECALLLELVLDQLERVWVYNASNRDGIQLTLDMQLSNWAILPDDSGELHVTFQTRLTYLDITTPLFRVYGKEQLEPAYLLRGCPRFLRRLVERFMAEGVVARYYDPRDVVIDILANCIKEGRSELLPRMVDVVNAFYARRPAGRGILPITLEAVYRYYRTDAAIWMLYLGLRKLDRFLKTKLLRQPYDFILPDRMVRNFPFRIKRTI